MGNADHCSLGTPARKVPIRLTDNSRNIDESQIHVAVNNFYNERAFPGALVADNSYLWQLQNVFGTALTKPINYLVQGLGGLRVGSIAKSREGPSIVCTHGTGRRSPHSRFFLEL